MLTTMVQSTVDIAGGLKASPSFLETIGTPHVLRGVIERLSVSVCFLVKTKGSKFIHLVSSQNNNQSTRPRTCKPECSCVFFPGPFLAFIFGLA